MLSQSKDFRIKNFEDDEAKDEMDHCSATPVLSGADYDSNEEEEMESDSYTDSEQEMDPCSEILTQVTYVRRRKKKIILSSDSENDAVEIDVEDEDSDKKVKRSFPAPVPHQRLQIEHESSRSASAVNRELEIVINLMMSKQLEIKGIVERLTVKQELILVKLEKQAMVLKEIKMNGVTTGTTGDKTESKEIKDQSSNEFNWNLSP